MIFVTKASWQGAQQQSTARAAGARIVYRADLPGVVKWRLVTPCGHWCCGVRRVRGASRAGGGARGAAAPVSRLPGARHHGLSEGVAWAQVIVS